MDELENQIVKIIVYEYEEYRRMYREQGLTIEDANKRNAALADEVRSLERKNKIKENKIKEMERKENKEIDKLKKEIDSLKGELIAKTELLDLAKDGLNK